MEKREKFVKSLDARDYIAKSAKKESENLRELTQIFDEWGKQLCDKPKEELDKIYEEKEKQYYCTEEPWLLNTVKSALSKYSKQDEIEKQETQVR